MFLLYLPLERTLLYAGRLLLLIYKLLGGKWVHSQVCTAAITQIKINDKEQYHEH